MRVVVTQIAWDGSLRRRVLDMREDGMAVVQAPEVDADTFAGLPNVLPGERAVYIKPDVILRAADEIRKRGLG